MVRFIGILLFLVLFISCASRKKSDKHISASSISGIDLNINKAKDNSLHQFDWSIVRDNIDLDINIKDYDTSANPDSVGNYPLKSETNIKSKRKTETEQQKVTEESKKENANTHYTANNQTVTEETEHIESSTEAKSPFNLNWLWLLIIPVAGYLLIKKYYLKK